MSADCKIRVNNTAESRCRADLGLYRKVVLTPINSFYTGIDSSSQPQTINEWLWECIHAADPLKRFYPMPEARGIEDASKEDGIFTDDYGEDTVLFEGNFGLVQKFRPDACLNKRLFAFNNQQFRGIIVDNQNNVQLIRGASGDCGELFRVFVTSPKANTASEISQPTIRYEAIRSEEHKNRVVVPTDIQWGQLNGLEDLIMNVIKDGSNINITFSVLCGGDNISDELAALSGDITAWVGFNLVGGAVSFLTAPTYDAVNSKFTIAASDIPVGAAKIGLANPSVLYGLGIGGFECSDPVSVPA